MKNNRMTDKCFLCLDETNTFFVSYDCQCRIHAHNDCIERWMKTMEEPRCMICKTRLNDKKNDRNDHYINDLLGFVNINRFDVLIDTNLVLFIVLSFLLILFVFLPLFIGLLVRSFIEEGYMKNEYYKKNRVSRLYDIYYTT